MSNKTASLQVPADVLERMTTDALLETVWNYPLLPNALFFTTMEQGIRSVFSYANSLQELARRPDREVVLARFYQQLTVKAQSAEESFPTAKEHELSGMTVSIQLAIAEAILFNPTFTSFTVADRDTILATDYSACSGTSAIEITPMAGENYTNGTVYAPNGSSVAVQINRNPELTSTEISNLNSYVAVNYPNVVNVSSPTVMYNCHSYAWYSASTSNDECSAHRIYDRRKL